MPDPKEPGVAEIVVVKDDPAVVFVEGIHSQAANTRRLHEELYELRRRNTQLEDQNKLLGNRLKHLETILQSSFARAVAGLSGARKQFGESQDAKRLVAIVEDHYAAFQFLVSERVVDEADVLHERPLLYGVRRLFHLRRTVTVGEPHAIVVAEDDRT